MNHPIVCSKNSLVKLSKSFLYNTTVLNVLFLTHIDVLLSDNKSRWLWSYGGCSPNTKWCSRIVASAHFSKIIHSEQNNTNKKYIITNYNINNKENKPQKSESWVVLF